MKIENIDYVSCPLCEMQSTQITSSHLRAKHQMTMAEFKSSYPDAKIVCETYRTYLSERIKGEKNPGYGNGGKFSPFSETNPNNTPESIAAMKQKMVANRKNYTTRLEYYTDKGMSLDEAHEALSKRQRTFTLEKCIKKYGDVEGRRIYNERQEKWIDTLSKKSPEEWEDINRRKIASGWIFSKIEEKFISEVEDTSGLTAERQFKFGYSFVDAKFGNKLIEFYGDFWHHNPDKFSKNYVNPITKRSSSEQWTIDAAKLSKLKSNGYDVLVVWESEYKKHRNETLQKCQTFLTR